MRIWGIRVWGEGKLGYEEWGYEGRENEDMRNVDMRMGNEWREKDKRNDVLLLDCLSSSQN